MREFTSRIAYRAGEETLWEGILISVKEFMNNHDILFTVAIGYTVFGSGSKCHSYIVLFHHPRFKVLGYLME